MCGKGVLRRGGAEVGLSGSNPTIGGRFVAVLKDGRVELLDRSSLEPIATVDEPGADSIAVSDQWLVYRAQRAEGGDGLFYRHIGDPSAPAPIAPVASVAGGEQISPPSLDGSTLVFGIASSQATYSVSTEYRGSLRHVRIYSRAKTAAEMCDAAGRTFTLATCQ